jgi:uncharacterized Zn finger protein (UPF0148 family)
MKVCQVNLMGDLICPYCHAHRPVRRAVIGKSDCPICRRTYRITKTKASLSDRRRRAATSNLTNAMDQIIREMK